MGLKNKEQIYYLIGLSQMSILCHKKRRRPFHDYLRRSIDQSQKIVPIFKTTTNKERKTLETLVHHFDDDIQEIADQMTDIFYPRAFTGNIIQKFLNQHLRIGLISSQKPFEMCEFQYAFQIIYSDMKNNKTARTWNQLEDDFHDRQSSSPIKDRMKLIFQHLLKILLYLSDADTATQYEYCCVIMNLSYTTFAIIMYLSLYPSNVTDIIKELSWYSKFIMNYFFVLLELDLPTDLLIRGYDKMKDFFCNLPAISVEEITQAIELFQVVQQLLKLTTTYMDLSKTLTRFKAKRSFGTNYRVISKEDKLILSESREMMFIAGILSQIHPQVLSRNRYNFCTQL